MSEPMPSLPTEKISQLFQQGFALHQQGQLAQAKTVYEDVLAKQPKNFDALHFLGVIAAQNKTPMLALELISQAISINPDHADAYYNRANILFERTRMDEALADYDKAIELNPEHAGAYANRGIVLKALQRFEEAIDSLNMTIALKPDYAVAYCNRGALFKDLERFDEALASFEKAISLKQNYDHAYFNRGNTLTELGRPFDALASYQIAFSLNPDFDFLLGSVIRSKMQLCDWDDFYQNINQYKNGITELKKITEPFVALSLIDRPELHKTASEVYIQAKYPKMQELGPAPLRSFDGKIRLAYYSADFKEHPVAYLMAELFELHDKNKFEVIAFSLSSTGESEIKTRLIKSFNQFIEVHDKSDSKIAEISRNLGIDIAIDLNGYTEKNHVGAFLYRLAPIQVGYIGYVGTMGSNFYDYIIADKILIRTDDEIHYSEKIAYLPSYQANDSKRNISEKDLSRKKLSLPEKGFVFCCFNNSYKILPSTFDSWIRILKSVEGSVLFLLAENDRVMTNLRREAEARGVSSKRLVFGNRLPRDVYLARYRRCDLFLDTLPYNAGTTASDALWAGLPVLTCTGKSFASRMAASLLTAIDMPELITHTQEDYEAKAIELATRPAMLQELKAKLARNRLTTPLFDSQLFAKHIEAAYEAMYARSQAGLPPEHIEILANT